MLSGPTVSQIESFEVTLPFIQKLKEFELESTNTIKNRERQTIESILWSLCNVRGSKKSPIFRILLR
jgi:hypothetical protein